MSKNSRIDINHAHKLTTSITAFASFTELLGMCKAGYLPTLRPEIEGAAKLVEYLKVFECNAWNPVTGQNW